MEKRHVNRLTLSGEVIALPERKEFAGGAAVTTVTLKCARPVKAGDPAKFDTIPVEAWRALGDRMGALRIGDRIVIDAILRSNEWTTPEGAPRSKLVVSVSGFEKVAAEAPVKAAVRAPVVPPAPVPADDLGMPF